MTNNVWKLASWKKTKIVVVRIIYVKISVHASYSSYGSRYSSHITVLPFWACFLVHFLHSSQPVMASVMRSLLCEHKPMGTTSWVGKNYCVHEGTPTIRGNNARQLVFPHQFPIWEIHAQVVMIYLLIIVLCFWLCGYKGSWSDLPLRFSCGMQWMRYAY